MTASRAARIWIVSPVFYDSESYRQLRTEILAALDERATWRDLAVEFVVVDDSGAVDAPTRTLRELTSTRVVSPPFNLGHQRAIVFGLRAIRPELRPDDYVVTLDADGEDQPVDVVRLLSEAKARSVEKQLVVLGRRTTRNESLKFRMMYLAFRMLFRAMTGRSIVSGNFAVQRGYFVLNTIDHPTFDLCFSTSLIALRRPISYVPCARGRRYAGQSRMNTFGLVAHGIRMMLPFAENLAVRLLTISCVAFLLAVVGGTGSLIAVGADRVPFMPFAIGVVLAVLVGTVTFVGFLTVFAGFAQSSAIALQGLDAGRREDGSFVPKRSTDLVAEPRLATDPIASAEAQVEVRPTAGDGSGRPVAEV